MDTTFVPPLHGAVRSPWRTQARTVCARQSRRTRRRAVVVCTTTPPPPSSTAAQALTEGDIVAVVRGSGVRAEVGIVTGTDSSGRNVDFAPLKTFVPEMYVRSSDSTTFVRSTQVRRVPSTWVEEQSAWIVLDADLVQAEDDISAGLAAPTVTVKPAPPPPSIGDVPPRQPFRPTRTQSFIGAALSVPVAAIAYSVFAAQRNAFANSSEGALLDIALITSASISVLSLIVGAALFLYGVNLPPEE